MRMKSNLSSVSHSSQYVRWWCIQPVTEVPRGKEWTAVFKASTGQVLMDAIDWAWGHYRPTLAISWAEQAAHGLPCDNDQLKSDQNAMVSIHEQGIQDPTLHPQFANVSAFQPTANDAAQPVSSPVFSIFNPTFSSALKFF